MSEQCGDCRFFKKGHYECHRFPPTAKGTAYENAVFAEWPHVSERDYCGEFTPCNSQVKDGTDEPA
jgi:hypothetical protein